MRKGLARIAVLLFVASAGAGAQVLDFDAVCAAPPCPVGTLYAPSGVTFTPNTVPIVAASDGLTGTNGPHYLSVNAFPHDVTLALSRPATFVTMNVSRATSSSGAFSLQVTLLKQGAPVANSTITLTTVNAWTPVSFTVAGGFDAVFFDASGAANMTFGIDNLQFGGTCNGFADVTPADAFCSAAEWLANRSITLGCAPGQYCPTQGVTRAAMALFMQRLGTAVAPVILRSLAAPVESDYQTSVYECRTTPFRVTGFRRIATAHARIHAFFATATKTLLAQVAISSDGGNAFGVEGYFFAQTVQPATTVAWGDITGPFLMTPGNEYIFAVRVQNTNYGGATTNATATVRIECELTVRIDAAPPGAGAPFDAAWVDVVQRGPQQTSP